jgi:nitroreductase
MLDTQLQDGTTWAGPRLENALDAACRAPSLHNSQPWAFRIEGDHLEVHLAPSRLLPASDPEGREARIACGAVVFNLRLLLAGLGIQPSVTLLPTSSQGALATIRPHGPAPVNPELAELRRAIPQRRTNRRPFLPAAVPLEHQHLMSTAVHAEGAILHLISTPARTGAVQRLAARAHAVQLADPAWTAEWDAWTHRTDTVDGVPTAAAGPIPAPQDRWTLRDYGTRDRPERVTGKDFEDDPLIAVIATSDDSVLAQLRAGQALQRMLLTATAAGLSASFVSQLIEVHEARRELRTLLGGYSHPQVVLRLGFGSPTAPTPRRPAVDCLLGA